MKCTINHHLIAIYTILGIIFTLVIIVLIITYRQGHQDTKTQIQPKFRIGIGYDIHKFIAPSDPINNSIKICGVSINHSMAIDAHSDGDVGIHAIADAILGATGFGDIGEHFPSSSDEWKNKDSTYFLAYAVKKALDKGYSVSNLDIVIICEKPKINPHKNNMKKVLSEILQVETDFVNIKATTVEKLDAIGRGEGIAVQAIVSMQYVK